MIIRRASVVELSALPEIERAAGLAFADIDMADVAGDELPTVADLTPYQADGRCWVAIDEGQRPVAYIIVDLVDGAAHIEQVSVDPGHAGRGIGRRLIESVERWAVGEGRSTVTLTTFTEVPWNGPYYQRLGFRYLDQGRLSPGLQEIRAAEGAHGLDRWPRAAMAKELGRTSGRRWR